MRQKYVYLHGKVKGKKLKFYNGPQKVPLRQGKETRARKQVTLFPQQVS